MSTLMTTAQLAIELQLHPESVRRMQREGRLPKPIKLSRTNAGDVRYVRADIDAWIEAKKTEAAS